MAAQGFRCNECGNFGHLAAITRDGVHVYQCTTRRVDGESVIIAGKGEVRSHTLDHIDRFFARINGAVRRVKLVARDSGGKGERVWEWRLVA